MTLFETKETKQYYKLPCVNIALSKSYIEYVVAVIKIKCYQLKKKL